MAKLLTLILLVLPVFCEGAGKPDILLGQVVSVSSPLVGEISRELKSGYEAYFEQLNQHGGIDGRKVRLVQKDDGYKADNTLALTRELIEKDKVVALVGYLGTPGPSLVVRNNVLVDNDIAMVGPSSGVASLLAEKNIFPVRATYESELAEIVAHAKAMQHKRIALLVWSAGAGPLLADAFPPIVKNAGLELVYQNLFKPSADAGEMSRTLVAAIDPLKPAKVDAVLLIAGGSALYDAFRELRARLPSTLPLYTISSVNWQDLIANLGLKKSQGIVISQAVPYPYSPKLPIVKRYIEQMRGSGRAVNYYSLEGYLGAAVTVDALRRAAPNFTRADVLAALAGTGKKEIGGFEIDYTEGKRHGFRKPDITLITSQGKLLR